MKSLEKWNKRIRPHEISNRFTPRVQKVLNEIDIDKVPLPEIDFDQGEGAFIYGPLKSGKTITSCCILLDFLKHVYLNDGPKHPRSADFVVVPDLLYQIKRSYDKTTAWNEDAIINRYRELDLLVLDEIGLSNKPSEWLLDTLYLIINYRYEHLKPTVFTSNLNLSEMVEVLGDDRITSRIQRMCRIIQKQPYS